MIARTHSICFVLATICCLLPIGCGPSSVEPATATVEPTSTEDPPAVESTTDTAHGSFYTVSTYNESVDPNVDFTKTISRAGAENKRVILQVGGDWCGWCSRITDYMSTNATVRPHLEKNFLVMKVTYPGEHADEFLSKYPKCDAYPHFFVLESNREFLHSQGTGELEAGKGYDDDVFMAFLTQWTP